MRDRERERERERERRRRKEIGSKRYRERVSNVKKRKEKYKN